MIGSLRGVLLHRSPEGEVLVEVAGLGYRVTMAPAASVEVGEVGDEVFVHVHDHLRDDAHTLYGFPSVDERRVFESLLGAHGVGPSLALGILSVHGPVDLARVLASGDLDALCLVPGVGKKTAARLLVELKGVLDVGDLDDLPVGEPTDDDGGSARADVREALAGLGYDGDEIREVLRDLPESGDATELVRLALRRLAVAR